MIQFGVESFVLYSAPVDMRKGLNTLSQVVMAELGRDPQCGEAFVFIGTRGDRLKILLWQKHGYWLCQHRLARGRFRLPVVLHQDGRVCAVSLSLWEWQNLLEGIIVKQAQRLPRFGV